MAERIKIVDGEVEITKIPDTTVSLLTRKEVVDKKAESQTTLDHLNLDVTEAQTEVDMWDDLLIQIDKE